MATKAIELAKAAKGEGCLGRADDDEPIFVLRGKDVFAPMLVEMWASKLENSPLASLAPAPRATRAAKIMEARELATAMRKWQDAKGAKLPD